jgi:hypothetical protein
MNESKNESKAGSSLNAFYYDKVVELCRERKWLATLNTIVEEGRPDDGCDWKTMYEEWSKEEPK